MIKLHLKKHGGLCEFCNADLNTKNKSFWKENTFTTSESNFISSSVFPFGDVIKCNEVCGDETIDDLFDNF